MSGLTTVCDFFDEAEYDCAQGKAEALNGIFCSLEDRFAVFERDNLQIMMQGHDGLREDGFTNLETEPEVESFIAQIHLDTF